MTSAGRQTEPRATGRRNGSSEEASSRNESHPDKLTQYSTKGDKRYGRGLTETGGTEEATKGARLSFIFANVRAREKRKRRSKEESRSGNKLDISAAREAHHMEVGLCW